MFKPLSLTPVSGRSMAAMFGSRTLAFVCSIMVLLMGFLVSASAQDKDKPADSQPSATAATGQTLSGDSAQTQTAPVADAGPEQRLVHIVPYGRGSNTSTLKNTSAPAGAHLTYFGGPVISNIHVVIVFWGTNVDPVVTTPGTIDQFFADITSSRYYDLLTEYSTVGVTGAGPSAASSNQAIGRGQFDATVTIIPAPTNCPGGVATCNLTDNQIQAELTNQLAAGHLPAPMKDAQGIIETFYMIYFPPGVHISLGGAPSCAAGGFCAYHSNTASLVPYGVLPDFGPASGCQAPHCGTGTEFQNITAVTSHEMSEAVTDAQVGSASVFDAPLAWYDHNNPPGTDLAEVGDICAAQDTTVSAGAHTYTVQTEFSNVQNDCVSAPPVLKINAPGQAGPGSAFNASLTIQSSVNSSTLAAYTGTVHFTSSDAGATLPADYTFVAGDAGTHTFSFTLSGLGNQTITATDTGSSGFVGSATINVNTTPDMSITKTHSGNFNTGQPGSYTITASNVGGGPSSGTVTVVDTLPASLTATAISGTGWTCALNTLTCTRADVLAGGASYPAITLSVTPGLTPGMVTNVATVSGGGETNTANDVANDLTTITQQGPDLTPTILVLTPGSPPLVNQGTTGAQFIVRITNVGNALESGTLTVVATLPVGLTATAMAGGGWTCTVATLTCTKTGALGAGIVDSDITVTFNVPLNAPVGLFPVGATVSTTDNDVNPANNTASTTINMAPVISLSTSTPTLIVTAGQQTQFVVDVRAGSQAGLISFSCSGLPLASTCSFNPPSLNSASGTVFMNIATTARATVLSGPHPDNGNPWLLLGLLSLAAMAGLAVKLRNQTSRRTRLVPILVTCGLLIVGIFAGCGGGGSTPPPPPPPIPGTPAGTFVVTFTATSPNGTASKTMNLVVN